MLVPLLRQRLTPYRSWLVAVVALQFVGVLAMLYLPSLNASIIDDGVVPGDTALIWRLGGVMLAVSCVQIVCSVGAAWFGARTATAFGRDLRRDLFQRVGTFSTREVQELGAPSLITRTTNDVQQVQMLVVMTCLIAVSSPIMMVGGVLMALREDLGLGWILAVVVPALFVSVGFVISRMVPSFRAMQSRIDEVNRVLREQIAGIRVVRAFVRERHETERFAVANEELTDVAVRAGRWMATMFPLAMLVVNVSSVFGLISVPTQSAYNAAKFGVRGFTDALYMELKVARHPVSATTVHPGGIKTNIVKNARLHESLGAAADLESTHGRFQSISMTSPEKAASAILTAVRRDRRRVTVGPDAKVIDLLSRLPAPLYQQALVLGARRELT